MKIENWSTVKVEQKRQLLRAEMARDPSIGSNVAGVVEAVKRFGDNALIEFTEKFDGLKITKFRVSEGEMDEALASLDADLRLALLQAKANIEAFHKAERPSNVKVETMPGVLCELQWRAIEKVGLYVPGGTAPLFSAVFMLAIPAVLAGCKQIVMCAPPQKDGKMNSATLAAARLCGLTEVYMIGGAQAIAAMAYGTDQVSKVDKIMGPGNAYVTMAKQLVAQDPDGAAIDMPAGPSEVMVMAGQGARANWVAADLLAQAEHDVLSQAVLLTCDSFFACEVEKEVTRQLALLPRADIATQSIANSRILLMKDEAEMIAVANLYAPEHLIIQSENAASMTPKITTAGSVFVGAYTPETAGDYASGTNHVLPTYGAARAYSGLSLYSFLRTMTVQTLTNEGLRTLAPTLIQMAEAEGLDAHAAAVRIRMVMED